MIRRGLAPIYVNPLRPDRWIWEVLSFVTLTTVGFGDITPVDPLARVLTVLEALFGQIYLVTFLAFLVGNYISQRDASRRVTALPSSPRIASGQDVDGGEARDKATTNAAEG
jgi:hypothetical protein